MAAAFSIAASVSGIVSLGLELSTRITTYINSVRSYDEEISAIHRQTKTLQSSLDVLKKEIPDISLKHQIASDTVLAALKSGELELEALRDSIEKLTGSVGQPRNLKSNFKHVTKKMIFPFHRDTLEALQQRLDRTNASLNAATHALGLVIISSIDQSSADALSQLSSISTTSNANNAISSSIKSSLDTFMPQADQYLLDINDSLNTRVPDIQQGLDSMTAAITRQEENIMRRIEEAQAELRESLSKLNGLGEKKESDPPRLLSATPEQRVLYRLVSSPAKLEELYNLHCGEDDVGYDFTIEQRDDTKLGFERTPNYRIGHSLAAKEYMPICICRQRHESLRRKAKLGSFSFTRLTRSCWRHLPECRYSKSEVIDKSDSMRLSYDGLRWLLSKAVDISISLHTGPQGLNIKSTITARPVVDETQAPVFRSLSLLSKFVCNNCVFTKYTSIPRNTVMHIVETTVHRILKQYLSRRSSPYEVNQKGESALHIWMDVLAWLLWAGGKYEESFTAMTKLLLEAGLPAALCSDDGSSAGIRLYIQLQCQTDVFDLKGLIYILWEDAPDIEFLQMHPSFKVFLNLRNTTVGVRKILGCGLLSSTILVGDDAEAENIIARYSSAIHERNLFNQTPFHLASYNPRILRLLMANAANSRNLDTPAADGAFALEYALRLTSSSCSEGSSWVACSSCPCAECVEIFMDSGWLCKFGVLWHCDDISHTARLKIIDRLVSERAILKKMGRKFLTSAEVDRHSLNEPSVLDYHARAVAKLLLQNGIRIPESVYITLILQPDWLIPRFRPAQHADEGLARCTSVYHDNSIFMTTGGIRLAELLYNKGFYDIDQANYRGHTPLSNCICSWDAWLRPSYILWLINHGANIFQHIPMYDLDNPHDFRYSTCIVAQSILNSMPRYPEDLPHDVEAYRQLVSLVAPIDQHDECNCRCIEAGCHTMKVLFNEVWEAVFRLQPKLMPQGLIESSSIHIVAKEISNIFRVFALDLTKWEKASTLALRYFTFETLELKHTCHSVSPHFGVIELPQDEIAEIEDDNKESINLLEELVEYFQVAYYKFESRDGQGDRFISFLAEVWSPKMQQVLADLEAIQLTADEKQKAEQIGVRWLPMLKDRYEKKDEEKDENLENWLRRLDEIMPDV